MGKYLGHSSKDWEHSMYRGSQAKAMKDAMKNPENYTKSQPNAASKAAFVIGSNVGAGKDGMRRGPDTAYYKIEQPSAPAPSAPAAAPAPPPKPVAKPVAKPTGTSDKLQAAYDFKKSGSNFASNTQAERKELTDSFKQKPSYDPKAGITSPEAGNFLDNYKLNLQGKVDKFRAEAT